MPTICGIDEAGRGPVVGPLVIAGVKIDQKDEPGLRKLGVRDSKLLSPARRKELFQKITGLALDFEILVIPPAEVDAALLSPDSNLNWLEAQKTAQILNRLGPDIAVIDSPSSNIRRYSEYLRARLESSSMRLIVEHKADLNHPPAAAASILAKVTRDAEIEKLHKKYGSFGSGYPSDPITKEFLKKNIGLPIYRKTWDTYKQAAAKRKQKMLGDF